MIVYKSTKAGFQKDLLSNDIAGIILQRYFETTGKKVGEAEIRSWDNSLMYMGQIISNSVIPQDSGISIEYQIPQSSKRVDFMISGQDDDGNENIILIELKQWGSINSTAMDGVVMAQYRHGKVETSHPSYQAWTYASLLRSFNSTVYEEELQLHPCAYLHNYEPDGIIDDPFYEEHIQRAPVFLKPDAQKLISFIEKFVKHGDKDDVLFRIESGKIRPSKHLADSLLSMLQGNNEFDLIDDQKVVFEKAMTLSDHADPNSKKVLIVEGGPGTGKSVVAINLLAELTRKRELAQYVTKNAAPRGVYESKLTGHMRKTEISNLFSGSGSFISVEPGTFQTLIVDEAHRLNERSGLYGNMGENQIKELIQASNCTVFFVDENQQVTWKDIGQSDVIENWAIRLGAEIHRKELASQFRCSGSDGYLAWLDDVLQIRETANVKLDQKDFDFRVVESPSDLEAIILEKNMLRNRSRMVAGYCWDWVSKKEPNVYDIVFPEYDFSYKWNLAKDGSLWIISPNSVEEIGCIHTCQGLEVDYIGVIIGPDLVVRDGEVITDTTKRSKMDSSVKGYKKMLKESPEEAREKADRIIKNTYRTLLTRGMKGCYVYCTDEETKEYLKSRGSFG